MDDVALITGAAGDIGAATARRLAIVIRGYCFRRA
jgi:NAD(P)-dependent dehydrogenase (short-subunit alcohol dehydrogenase family)